MIAAGFFFLWIFERVCDAMGFDGGRGMKRCRLQYAAVRVLDCDCILLVWIFGTADGVSVLAQPAC